MGERDRRDAKGTRTYPVGVFSSMRFAALSASYGWLKARES